MTQAGDSGFVGSIPQIYERLLVPLIFEPYAADLAKRVASAAPKRVLEVAAGTGVVTRRLAASLPDDVAIVATDLNQPMLDVAASVDMQRAVQWQRADALNLPFADAAFDVVVCQFSVMFFPDKAKAFSEARRVLRPGGTFLFNVWDRIEENEFADTVTNALEAVFPDDPPRFMARTPHGTRTRNRADLARGHRGSPRSTRGAAARTRRPRRSPNDSVVARSMAGYRRTSSR